jgi:hypothetical protein
MKKDNLNPAMTVPKEELLFYIQAASELGIRVTVAPNGQPYSVSEDGTALIAPEGQVGINYCAKQPTNQDGSRFDYTRFSVRTKQLIAQAQRSIILPLNNPNRLRDNFCGRSEIRGLPLHQDIDEDNCRNNRSSSYFAQMDKELLPIYQQAADLQGVNLAVIAQEGQIFDQTIKVSKDCVAVSLTREKTEGGLHDFWETIKLIEAELPNVRIG